MINELISLNAKDYKKIKPYFEKRDSIACESIIFDAYLWAQYYDAKYFINDKGLMWVFHAYNTWFTGTPLCKLEDMKYCFNAVKEYFNQVLNEKIAYMLVDEEAVNELNLPEDEYEITEDRDYFDYIYDADKLRALSGKKYHKKKNHVNAFIKEYGERCEYKQLNCADHKDILDFLDKWKAEKCSEDIYNRLDYEVIGIKNVLNDCRFLESRMCGIYIDGQLEAFSIGSYSERTQMAVIHIEKANMNIRGLYPYINQQFLINGFPEAKIVNREDDMGLEGLRKAKLSYHPIELVKKYKIVQR